LIRPFGKSIEEMPTSIEIANIRYPLLASGYSEQRWLYRGTKMPFGWPSSDNPIVSNKPHGASYGE
jgi:hypothetical protein